MSGGREGTWGGSWAEWARVASLEQSAAVALSRGGSLSALSLLKDGAAGRVGGAHELSELGVAELGVTVGVDAAHDGQELGLAGIVAHGSQEGAEVEGVDSSIVVAVDAAVSGERREVVADLELALEDVEASLQVDLLLEDVEEGALDVVGQTVEAADAEGWAIESDVPQKVVRAGQQHLQEATWGEKGSATMRFLRKAVKQRVLLQTRQSALI